MWGGGSSTLMCRGPAFSGPPSFAPLFPAALTALAALGIGLLAMREPYILAFARQALGTGRFMADSAADAALVAIAVTGLFALQFGVTWAFAQAAMRLPTLQVRQEQQARPAGLVNVG